MSRTEADVIAFPTKTKLVCSSCGAPGEGSCRCGVPYITPGERAEAAVKANPGKSDRAIAEDIGVSPKTVSKARRSTTVEHSTVAKRTGKDGRTRKQPKRKTAPEKFSAAVQSRQHGKTQAEAAKEAGLGSVQTVKIAEAYDQGRAELLDELNIDPKTLAPSAQAKLEAAKRMMERKLNAEHAARMCELNEEVRKRVLTEGKEYIERMKVLEEKAWQDEKHWREMINNHKPPFTPEQFKTILMCLHPDGQRTQEKLSHAFRLFNNKKLQLTGKE
jgi:hypothetical protein